MSKFSFYYFNPLSTQVSSIETMRMIYDENISKLQNGINFLRKLENFQKHVVRKERTGDAFCCFYLICEENIEIMPKSTLQNSDTQTQEETPMVHHILFESSCTASKCDYTTEDSRKEKSPETSFYFKIKETLNVVEKTDDLEIISNQIQEEICWTNLARPNQVVYFDCKAKEEKYFLLRSEPQIVVAFKIARRGILQQNTTRPSNMNSNHSDVNEVSQFLHEIARDTRCNNVFVSLKSASTHN